MRHAGHEGGGGGWGGRNEETDEQLQAVCDWTCVNLLMAERSTRAPSAPPQGHVFCPPPTPTGAAWCLPARGQQFVL